MKAIYFTLRGSSLSYASSNGEKITMVCFGVTLSMLFFLQHERGGVAERKKDGRIGGKMKRMVVRRWWLSYSVHLFEKWKSILV